MQHHHFDEAKDAAVKTVSAWLNANHHVERALLVRDLFGKFRLAIWEREGVDVERIRTDLAAACGPWWSGHIDRVVMADELTRALYDEVRAEARPVQELPRLLVLDRHRSRMGWFVDEDEPIWRSLDEGPPVIVFYSFKGGLGCSTCLAAFAIQRARAGERVCVLDLDLDSPGVGRLLSEDASGRTASWGVVDYLIEQSYNAPLSDYYHRCDRVAGAGELIVFPAGRIDEAYTDKLARVDMEDDKPIKDTAIGKLLERIRDELNPNWILLDSSLGFSDWAGRLLSGWAHLHVLLGTTQDQSWQGLNRVLDRLGKSRVERDKPQHEVLMIQAMVPVGYEAGRMAREAFLARAEREFLDRYYAQPNGDDERFWTTDDFDSSFAPHVPAVIEYEQRLADFPDIEAVANFLCSGAFKKLETRIVELFQPEIEWDEIGTSFKS